MKSKTRFLLTLGLIAYLFGCQASTNAIETGGETHFLKSCSPEDNTCGSSFECVCGVCTRLCDTDLSCSNLPGASCVSPGEPRCGADTAPRCDVECRRDDDCAAVSPFHVCDDGRCRTQSPKPIPRDETTDVTSSDVATSEPSSSAPVTSSAAPDAGPTDACERGLVAPNEVLIIGDSFFALTHQVTAYLEEAARQSGVLGAGERYRDNSRVVNNTLISDGILNQYLTARDDAEVRVVIMNGGGADAVLAACETIDASCPILASAVSSAEDTLAAMAENGVVSVVYAFYPEARDDALRAKVDVLRPLIEQRCATAPVDCHWLDLRTTFDGNYDAYLGDDGMLPSSAGAEASARAIWQLMQERCIAQ